MLTYQQKKNSATSFILLRVYTSICVIRDLPICILLNIIDYRHRFNNRIGVSNISRRVTKAKMTNRKIKHSVRSVKQTIRI